MHKALLLDIPRARHIITLYVQITHMRLILATILAALVASGIMYGHARYAARSAPSSKPAQVVSTTEPDTLELATPTTPLMSSLGTTTQPADSINAWHLCENRTSGYRLYYPADWSVWQRVSGGLAEGTCETAAHIIYFGPNIYSAPRPPQLQLELQTATARANVYVGHTSMDAHLLSSLETAYGVASYSTITPGITLTWFEDAHYVGSGNAIIIATNNTNVFYTFTSTGVDRHTLAEVMSSFALFR